MSRFEPAGGAGRAVEGVTPAVAAFVGESALDDAAPTAAIASKSAAAAMRRAGSEVGGDVDTFTVDPIRWTLQSSTYPRLTLSTRAGRPGFFLR